MSGSSGGYCPICGKSYGPEADRCPIHGFLFQSRDALRPGVVIDGAYEILERLGAGGMGETYLVRHAYLGENLVLKRIRPELAEDPLYQQSFLREAHSLAALRKLPAVVEIRNAWQTREGYLALLLEYVEGGNLLRWLETERGGGPLEALEAVAVAADLAKALASAHAIGVLHRDVKPQNILMRKLEGGGFQLKLCDFGLAVQRVEEMSQQGTTTTRLGTPGYAAPEQYTMSSREQDARVDVFGLGMTLYRLAAGRLPWEASSASWPLVCKEQPRKGLKELRPSLGREYWLESLLLRMTAVERNDRIATASEALELMQEALAETRPAPATVVRPQPPVAGPIESRQIPPSLPKAKAASVPEQKIPGVPMAAPVDTGRNWQVASTAGALILADVPAPASDTAAAIPTESPEPPVLPPAELRQPPIPLESPEDAATDHELPAETVALNGTTGHEMQAEPASVEIPAHAAVPADDQSASAPTLSSEPEVPPAAELQRPLQPPSQVSEDTAAEHVVPTDTVALTGATGGEPQVESATSAEVLACAATPTVDQSASAQTPPSEPQQHPAQASEDTATEHVVPGLPLVVTGATGEEPHAEPSASAEMPASAAALAVTGNTEAPSVSPEPSEGAIEAPAIKPPFLRPQVAPKRRSKRTIALAVSGFVVIAVMLGWRLALQEPKSVPGNPPAQVEQGKQAPVPHAPAPAAGPPPGSFEEFMARQTPNGAPAAVPRKDLPAQSARPQDGDIGALRTSAVGAIRARDWSKAGPLIDGLLAKLPTDAEALEWRKLLSEGRRSDLLAKLNPKREASNESELVKAEQQLQQGDYSTAIATFQRVLASDPGNTRARDGLKRAKDAKAIEDSVFGGGR
jgi:serine/threonine-protein kinase